MIEGRNNFSLFCSGEPACSPDPVRVRADTQVCHYGRWLVLCGDAVLVHPDEKECLVVALRATPFFQWLVVWLLGVARNATTGKP